MVRFGDVSANIKDFAQQRFVGVIQWRGPLRRSLNQLLFEALQTSNGFNHIA
jgi:hypothetical protein